MFLADFFAALVVGLFLVFVISVAFGTKGPWGSLIWFFMVVALFAWVAGVWLRPYGPMWFGIGWVPIIFVGFLIALLLTTVSPRKARKRDETLNLRVKTITEDERDTGVDIFLWVLIIVLVVVAISHYYWYPQIGWY